MKKALTLLALIISLSGYGQRIDLGAPVAAKIDLHIIKESQELKTGKGFFFTGLGMMMASSALLLVKESPQEYAGAVGLIGGTFATYGFFTVLNSGRYKKKIDRELAVK